MRTFYKIILKKYIYLKKKNNLLRKQERINKWKSDYKYFGLGFRARFSSFVTLLYEMPTFFNRLSVLFVLFFFSIILGFSVIKLVFIISASWYVLPFDRVTRNPLDAVTT